MKLCKKLVLCVLAVAVVLLCFAAFPQPAQAVETDLFTLGLDESMGGYVLGRCKESAEGDLVIPDTYNGRPVVGVGMNAFRNLTGLTSVTIPETITYIGEYAFAGCTGLTSVTLPDSLRTYGKGIFQGCTGLTSVDLGNGIRSVPTSMFEGCASLTSITVPSQVLSVGARAFAGCTSLKSVTILGKIQTIYDSAFANCSVLESLSIPDTVTDVADNAFTGCSAFSFNIYDNGAYLGNEENPYIILMYAIDKSIESCQLSSGTKAINHNAFEECSALVTVGLNDGLYFIGDRAFYNCANLQNITIPDTVNSIGQASFMYCASMPSAHIPAGITVIRQQAFFRCKSLTSIVLPDSVTKIEKNAFLGCENLVSVRMGINPVYIVDYAFDECDKLENINFPKGVNIRQYVFSSSVLNVVYCGTPSEWAYAYVGQVNYALADAPKQNHKYQDGLCIFCEPRTEKVLTYRLDDNEDLAKETTVYVDGLPYEVQRDDSGYYVELPEAEELLLVTYSYYEGDGQDIHTQYPNGMKIYQVKDGKITHLPELDNLLQYSGSSIRITGKKGIRMITSIDKAKKTALTGKGLAGYTVVEYGTVLSLVDEIPEGNILLLGRSYARSNYAYKKGVADPVFATTADAIQYTNVLVGFAMYQCDNDIAMRPYIILKNAQGKEFTVHGGIVYRSIGYIAYQNRTVFQPKTGSYDFVWEIIHYVYGDKYDADYKG